MKVIKRLLLVFRIIIGFIIWMPLFFVLFPLENAFYSIRWIVNGKEFPIEPENNIYMKITVRLLFKLID
jgi:hypothetical protein